MEFCSEACFIPEWYAEHCRACPHADSIKREVAEKQENAISAKGGAALLVATALSHSKPPSETTPQPPKKLRYVLSDFQSVGAPLGGGSYGKVTKVVHKRTSEVFAMKVIPKQKVVEHQMEDYLAREVKTQLSLQHPNILKLLYYFEDAEEVHLLLEFASGGSLFGVLKRSGRLAEEVAARYYTDVAMALDHLHNKGVVHRDLKPENILMCEGDVAKLADFGWCAELEKGGAPRRTFCGTWDYLSPEMVNSEPHDHCVDIWAIGVLNYEMLTSRSPFAASSQVKALMRITKVDLQIPDYVSILASDLIRKLLVKEPADRLRLEKSIEHPWVKQFIPDVSARLSESIAKNAAAVERAAERAAAEAAAAVATEPELPPEPDLDTAASFDIAAVAAVGSGHGSAKELGTAASLDIAAVAPEEPSTANPGSISTEALDHTVASVPEEPVVLAPVGDSSVLEQEPSLSTMPWVDEKVADLATPRTTGTSGGQHEASVLQPRQVVTSSSLSSLSQSRATLEIQARQEGAGELPSATAAVLQALRDPQSPVSALSAHGRLGEEELPEAMANFLGALRSGSIMGGSKHEALETSYSESGSSSMDGGRAKKEAMRGLRDKIAQRRVQLEQQRSALEEEQLQLERRDLELSHGCRSASNKSSFPGSPSHSPRSKLSGAMHTDYDSPSVLSPIGKLGTSHLSSPRCTGSQGSGAYAELRSWVQGRTEGLRKDHGLVAVTNSYDTDSPPEQLRAAGQPRRDRLGAGGLAHCQ